MVRRPSPSPAAPLSVPPAACGAGTKPLALGTPAKVGWLRAATMSPGPFRRRQPASISLPHPSLQVEGAQYLKATPGKG